jgi:hypothetical protein
LSNPYRDKLLSVGYLSRGRTRARVREGRQHPESGKPYKAVTDELGNTTTEHNIKGDRQDVLIRPETVRVARDPATGKLENLNG